MRNALIAISGIVLVIAVSVEGFYIHNLSQRIDSQAAADSSLAVKPDRGVQVPDDFLDLTPPDPQNWDPEEEMRRMRERMNDLFSQTLSRFPRNRHFNDLLGDDRFSPRLDLKDEGDKYQLKVNIPGAEKSDIHVAIKDGRVLSIDATTSDGSATAGNSAAGRVLRRERYVGQFQRMLTLPEAVDPDSLKSDYKDGVLTLEVNKRSA